jgi:ribulose-bisphosphate carboxylase large chain
VASLRQAWEAARTGVALEALAARARELARAIEFFGRKTG